MTVNLVFYAGKLVRTHAGPMIATSVFVSPYESCLVDLVGHFSWCTPLIYPNFYNQTSLALLQGSPISERGNLVETNILDSLHIMSRCGYQHLFPSDDDRTRH